MSRVPVRVQYLATPPTLNDTDVAPFRSDLTGALIVGAEALPLPAGAATEATLAAMSAKLPATLGAKTIANALAVSIASDQTVPISAAALPLPAGAATETTLSAVGVVLAAMSAKLPAALGQTTMSASLAVTVASDQSAIRISNTSATSTRSSVAAAAADTLLLAANAARKGATIYNDSASATLYLAMGTTAASLTNFSAPLAPITSGVGGYYELPFGFTGEVRGIWSAAVGNARISELT